ncbi:VOC family protein [Chamaesiphon sp. VAR_69_metabat_338]|uniref:VOC family protein n=1 Tax=Chamaesiphon sp. VAR_69_metabat_338 TaxID=2964704 RepID=UPI00286D8538|nr:VOC family protein [Chamaesiphon sp. VAR_69_metabat_338]
MNEFIFHLAFPIANIPDTKKFYVDGLGCSVGRETVNSLILNLYGHQLVAHVADETLDPQQGIYPRHFGIVFPTLADWQGLHDRAQSCQLSFYQAAKHRFSGSLTEHRTFFLIDPFANLLEFKYYRHEAAIFGAKDFTQIGDLTG